MRVGEGQYSAIVIGCGKIGSRFTSDASFVSPHSASHAEAYAKNKKTRLVGLSDVSGTALAEAGQFWKIENLSYDPIDLYKKTLPDLVSICSPDDTHVRLLESLMSLPSPPKGILVEKPLALSGVDAEKLQLLAKDRQICVLVNYSRRFSPFFREVASKLKDGSLGRPIGVQAIYGKGLFHNGCHMINLIRFWFGEPRRLSCSSVKGGLDNDPTVSLTYECEDGLEIQVLGIDERVVTAFEMDVLTDRFRFHFSLGGQVWQYSRVGDSPTVKGYKNYLPTADFPVPPRDTPMAECLDQAVCHLVDLIEGKSVESWSPIEDALGDLLVLEKIKQLAGSGKT